MPKFEKKTFTPFKAWKRIFEKDANLRRYLIHKRVKCRDYRIPSGFITGIVISFWDGGYYKSIAIHRDDNGDTIWKSLETVWQILEDKK